MLRVARARPDPQCLDGGDPYLTRESPLVLHSLANLTSRRSTMSWARHCLGAGTLSRFGDDSWARASRSVLE
jgi:hypothetical protein